MIEKIIEFSIRNRFVVILLALCLVVWGIYAVIHTPVDAIPDLSENQVIVFTDWMGRSPQEIEDQITYPLSVNLQGLAGVKAVRSSSEFNFSMIDVIFEDNVDFYFARQRVLERLTLAGNFLPEGVLPYMAPDATALGQIFWYTVEGPGYDLGRLRAIQDWYVRYQLNSVPGVAQVASAGGFPIEYQIDVDPHKLRAYNVTLGELFAAVSRSNSAVGGKVIQKGNAEYIIRGVGWLRDLEDIAEIVVKADPAKGVPVTVANLGTVGLGSEFRRSVLEKDGNEAVGAVVMMRYGENPLEVTRRIKDKIRALQPALPEGVRIVPFYDRTRLIQGAIETLTGTLRDEIIIASLAVLLILMHLRSALVISMTLPLAVLTSFILMRHFGIASNIMSLSGIAISIGILVDQAIVMVENATHQLTAHFGPGRKISGDTREIVIPACRTVGRPIFFSVMIILLSFLPVFALSGREGKTFHPLAFTKSFAMIGVAVLSITLVPALIPTFIKGRLRSEEESWLVRSLIGIYKPWLTWLMPRRNLAMWSFSALLIAGAGLFPLDAVLGIPWRTCFLAVVAVTMCVTLVFIVGIRWQVLSFATLAALALAAYHFPKIGKEYMPPLDEGSILDMPVTVPRASVTEAADDLKLRDSMLRRFPEVEMVVGKAGRADTPTDPSPLEMIETIITLRPKEYWPKRSLEYKDAHRQATAVLAALQKADLVETIPDAAQRQALLDTAAMNALARTEETLREVAFGRRHAFESELGPKLLNELLAEVTTRFYQAGRLPRPVTQADIDRLAGQLQAEFAPILATGAAAEDVDRLLDQVAKKGISPISGTPKGYPPPGRSGELDLSALPGSRLYEAYLTVASALGMRRPTLADQMLDFLSRRRDAHWCDEVRRTDLAIFDQAAGAFDWYAIEEIHKLADEQGLWTQEGSGEFRSLRAELDAAWSPHLLLWKKSKDGLVEEMRSTVRVPGWSNIFTQPIINRIEMLVTGVRTMVGVKVFGNDQEQIQAVSEEIAEVLKEVPGADSPVPDQSLGKGYLEIRPDRRKAARYGVNIGDIQDVIETALGGRAVTTILRDRERYPLRIRYARAFRKDEEDVKNLLVNAAMPPAVSQSMGSGGGAGGMSPASGKPAAAKPVQIPLGMVADVKIVEGPAVIKSENGTLRNYVQLNVTSDRDAIGFVEEARRAVVQKVKLPHGVHIEWTGEFESQERARNTLLLVYPLVLLLIFVILYLTYNDLLDAVLMMMCVPEAAVGGILVLWLCHDRFSVAVQVGFIACFGMATETGIIMLVYLREAIERRGGLARIGSLEELRQAVVEGAVHRLRPKLLTEGVAIVALAPMLWASGPGHEVLSAMAAPVLGGLLIADEVVDIFIPVRFYWVRRARWLKLKGLGIGD
jgi:Cu(I)/Ag(I) efflux system membrane protein CusA/SilA